MTQFSALFPPINRYSHSLGPLEILIDDNQGSTQYDPNWLAIANFEGQLKELQPCALFKSDISGKPGVRMCTSDVRICLTLDELDRMTRRDLKPFEFFALAVKFGVFFEIHDDFYDEVTGQALQPNRSGNEPADLVLQLSRAGDWVRAVDAEGEILFEGHRLTPRDTVDLLEHFGVRAEVEEDVDFDA